MSAIAAVVLAAGQASRYRAAGGQGPTKLLAQWKGVPLVRHAATAALRSRANPVILVTGHAVEAVTRAVEGLPLLIVHNPAYADGIAGSIAAGLAAVPSPCVGAVILLADMPDVTSLVVDRLIDHALADGTQDAVVPHGHGRRGNPVLLHRRLFAATMALSGDKGARHLLRDPSLRVQEVPINDIGILRDIDLPDDLGPSRA